MAGEDRLRQLHENLVHGLGLVSCRIIDPTYTCLGEGYSPHVSSEKPLPVGEEIGVWSVLVIAKYTKGNALVSLASDKVLDGKFRLGGTIGA